MLNLMASRSGFPDVLFIIVALWNHTNFFWHEVGTSIRQGSWSTWWLDAIFTTSTKPWAVKAHSKLTFQKHQFEWNLMNWCPQSKASDELVWKRKQEYKIHLKKCKCHCSVTGPAYHRHVCPRRYSLYDGMYQQQDGERANSEVETCDEQISSVAHLHEGFGARFGNGTQVINHLLAQVFDWLSKYRVCHCSAPLWSCQFQYPLQWHFLPQLIFPNKLQVWKKDVQ